MKLRSIVIDANIIVRAVLGVRVSTIMETYDQIGYFVTPDMCMQDANKYLPLLAEKRGLSIELIQQGLSQVEKALEIIRSCPGICLHL